MTLQLSSGMFRICLAWLVALLAAHDLSAQLEVVRLRAEQIGARIDTVVGPHAREGLFSGVILAVRHDSVIFERGYGFSNWELRVPNSPGNIFGIASITKVMTKIVVDALVREKKLDLDGFVDRYLPGFPRGPGGGRPTVRHLVDHEAGIPHRVTDDVDETQPMNAADLVERVKGVDLLFEPGSESSYSSAGYTCLARIIEIVEGMSFDAVLRERVFSPAGMSSSMSETGSDLVPGRAMPYRLGLHARAEVVKPAPYKHLGFLTGAGSVFASAGDLAQFVRAITTGAFGAGARERMLDGDPNEWQGLYGRTNGYEASVDLLPAQGLILVVLTNLQSASTWQLRDRIKRIIVGEDVDPVPMPPQPVDYFEDPARLVGTYGPAEITFTDGMLFRGDNEFYPVEDSRYYIPGSGSMMRFRRDSTGTVDALVSLGSGSERVLPRSEHN